MRRKEIRKRSGGVRVVFCPSGKERKLLRGELKRMTAHTVTTLPYAHGFMPERSPLTAAKAHVGFDITIGLDLKDFFPSVKPAMVRGLIPKDLNPLCWSGEGCGQGLPTAPAIANLAAKSMDEAIVKMLKKQEKEFEIRFSYTRYADDLSISLSPDPGQEKVVSLKSKLSEIVRRCGFTPNARKWRVMRAAGGRREVVGLLVGPADAPIRPLRAWRRKYRSLQHNIELLRVRACPNGLELGLMLQRLAGWRQWMEPRMPLTAQEKKLRADQLGDVTALVDANRIVDKVRGTHIPTMTAVRKEIPAVSETLPDGLVVRITNDPAYFVGISDFVTRAQRTASCLRTGLAWNTGLGQYGGTGSWWWQLRGCSIAQLVDPKQIVDCAGVKRPAQLARVLVFKLSNGDLVCQRRTYAESSLYADRLQTYLKDRGFDPARSGHASAVVGEVKKDPKRLKPYLDGGRYTTVTKDGVIYDRVEM